MKKFAVVLVPVLAALFLAASPALADVLNFAGASDTTVEATSTSGAVATFTVTATDASSTPFATICNPPSGSLFPLGTTTVSCDAVDSTGATSTANFDVGVFEAATSTATSTPVLLDVEGTTSVPASCEVLDSTGAAYDFPATSSPSVYLGICALKAAKDAGVIADYQLSNFPGIGLFVASIAGVAADPSSEYWALYQNGSFANCGLGCLPVSAGDTIEFQLHDFSDNDLGDHITLHIGSLIATSSATSSPAAPSAPSSGGSGGGGGTFHQTLNVPSALAYLVSEQHADGSFDSDLLSDWAAIAFAAADPGAAKNKLKNHVLAATPSFSSVTDYERHAMALEALGIDPSSGTSVDTIAHIVGAFDGAEIGDPSLVNDDMFALFPLLHAGYRANDQIIQKTVLFIISKQRANGSWENSVDLTAAAIQALKLVQSLPGTSAALANAEHYLHAQQQGNGGWSNSFSTSWTLQAISALGESVLNWSPAGATPQDYLASVQQGDGGIEPASTDPATRAWATEYAIPAAAMKDWDSLLASFSLPANGTGAVGGASSATSTAQEATTTLAALAATTTPQEATTTPPAAAQEVPAAARIASTTAAFAVVPKINKPKAHKPLPMATPSSAHANKESASNPLPPISPQTQTAAAATPERGENIFVRVWDFFKRLLGL